MAITREEIKNLAHLARIEMGEAEMDSLVNDFSSILGYVDQLNQIELPDASDTTALLENVTREDQVPDGREDVVQKMLDEAPESEQGFYKVPKIL